MFALALLIFRSGFSADPVVDTVPFATGEVGVRAGAVLPLGSLARHYDPAGRIGARLSIAHWNSVFTRIDLEYANLDGSTGETKYFLGTTGFEWRPPQVRLEGSAGLGLFYVRTKPDPAHPRLDADGESEFGLVLRAAWRVWERDPWTVRLEGSWEDAFTRPQASTFAGIGVSVSRRAW
jgi:hypothetical protein